MRVYKINKSSPQYGGLISYVTNFIPQGRSVIYDQITGYKATYPNDFALPENNKHWPTFYQSQNNGLNRIRVRNPLNDLSPDGWTVSFWLHSWLVSQNLRHIYYGPDVETHRQVNDNYIRVSYRDDSNNLAWVQHFGGSITPFPHLFTFVYGPGTSSKIYRNGTQRISANNLNIANTLAAMQFSMVLMGQGSNSNAGVGSYSEFKMWGEAKSSEFIRNLYLPQTRHDIIKEAPKYFIFASPPPPVGGVIGTLDETFEDMTLSSSATVGEPVTGDLDETFEEMVLTSLGTIERPIDGNLDETFEDMTLSSSATVGDAVTGNLNETFEDMALSSSATVGEPVTGDLDETFEEMVLTSSGTIIPSSIIGDLDETFEEMVLTSSGTFIPLPIVGALDETFENMTLSSTGGLQLIEGSVGIRFIVKKPITNFSVKKPTIKFKVV